MTDFESAPVLLPWWRQSKKILPVVVLALLLVPAVILVGIRQLSPKASSAISIQVSPGAINQSSSPQIGKPVYLSATAVDEVGRPITTGVSYAWGISSNFAVSPTFVPSNNLATFTPNSTGSGSLWVSAITSESSAIKYVDVCIGVPCPSYTNPTPTPQPTADTPVTRSVFLLIFNPILESQGSVKLTTFKGWSDPDTISNTLISTFPQISHGYLNYSVKERQEVDGIFVKPDGYQYTDDTYLACVNGTGPCHSPDIINYQQLFTAYDLCNKNVDEVWLWGGPYFGYQEYNPVNYCGKTQFVMGFNYERGLGEALHDFGHRMEFIGINRVGNGNWQQDENNEWNKFSLIAGHCGNIHYPPGTIVGQEEYDYSKTSPVSTDCDGYLNYPTGPFTTQTITCSAWSCSQEGYVSWWLSRIPFLSGTSVHDNKTLYNNWWRYYAFYDQTAPTPVPASFSNLSAKLPQSGPATFNFSYAGPDQTGFAVDISTLPDMSTDVYLNFASGTSSPLIESNPQKWDKVTCGRVLYWVVRAASGFKSTIQSVTVSCPTPTPVPNRIPVITTTFLPYATVGQEYNTYVYGSDPDSGDRLSMKLTIPTGYGLSAGPCSATSSPATIFCAIFGTPTKSSPSIPVGVSLTDGKATVSANLSLSISKFRPLPSPTPTPTPVSNVSPAIVTKVLPVGFVGRPYYGAIVATDPDLNDYLTAEVFGLPSPLHISGCTQYLTTVRNLTCTISGVPKSWGFFPVKITVTDLAKASASKTINLSIFKKYLLF